jgi:hypothetical protein
VIRLQQRSKIDPDKLWRVPAVLALIGAVALPFGHWIGVTERGTVARTAFAHISALGVCAAAIGLGVGLWTALRRPRLTTASAALFAAVVAALWWLVVFAPLLDSHGL